LLYGQSRRQAESADMYALCIYMGCRPWLRRLACQTCVRRRLGLQCTRGHGRSNAACPAVSQHVADCFFRPTRTQQPSQLVGYTLSAWWHCNSSAKRPCVRSTVFISQGQHAAATLHALERSHGYSRANARSRMTQVEYIQYKEKSPPMPMPCPYRGNKRILCACTLSSAPSSMSSSSTSTSNLVPSASRASRSIALI